MTLMPIGHFARADAIRSLRMASMPLPLIAKTLDADDPEQIAAWLQERGHHMTGPTREVYLNSPAEVEEADLLTEILFPIDAEGTN